MLVFSSLDPFDDLIAGVPMNFSCMPRLQWVLMTQENPHINSPYLDL